MNKQAAKKALHDFLDWGYRQEHPVILARTHQGILGQVPPQNVGDLLDAWADPLEKEGDNDAAPHWWKRWPVTVRSWGSRVWARVRARWPFHKG